MTQLYDAAKRVLTRYYAVESDDDPGYHERVDAAIDGLGVLDALVKEFDSGGLENYFRDQEDKRLGRWRWPENPDYYVKSMSLDRVAVVYDHSEGLAYGQFNRVNVVNPFRITTDPMANAARAYFDAHPEPKPWHDAKPGEVWVLTVAEIGESAYVSGDFAFRAADHAIDMTSDRIIAGRCISREGN